MNTTASPHTSPESRTIAVSQLQFDQNNPRFSPEIAKGAESELIERFIRDERLLEVLNSIADQGYFSGEPLLVVEVPDTSPAQYRVIEGNRRLAALKLLNGLTEIPRGRTSIEEACEQAKHKPAEVPCLIFPSDEQILRYLGFRHITGIKSWGSLQKARYIKKLRDRFYKDFEPRPQLTALAREIGSRADYVGQMLTALNLYDRAEADNFYGVVGLESQE
ncbi:MAG: ParB/Srx family N-terminal domain-containing protein, partial [Methylophilaceae bacterium]|nr:ParB/Srx family N-terminal domain-containing protein [Methylophilaceae bacterium]